MAQKPRNVTVELAPEVIEKLERFSRDSNRTIDEVIHEAVVEYFSDDDNWQELLDYGSARATRCALTQDDVERVIDEYRSETG